jgi:NAD(P)-dependent dehydrogenase (short-subunit alcohol dehydrogenase family)
MQLDGKVALITGAARGIGQEYARAMAAEGARIVAADITDCDDTIALVEGVGGQAISVRADVTSADDTKAMVQAAVDAFGRLDVLVNNAAKFSDLGGEGWEALDGDEWDSVMAVNVMGSWLCAKAAVPAMRATGGGSIINISSCAALFGSPNSMHYVTSKMALVGLTRSLARAVGRDFIRVNAVAPTMVLTDAMIDFYGEGLEKATSAVVKSQALRETLRPADIAGTVIYLASDASKFVTGQTHMVDGGTVFT